MQTREQRDDVLDTFKQTIARLKSTGSGKSLGGAALAEAKKAAEARVAERRREEHEPVDRSMVDDSPDKASSTVHHRTLDTEKVNMQKSSKRLSLSDLTGPPKTGEHRVQPSTTEIQTISGTSDQRTEVARPLIANVTATPNSPRSGKRVPSLNLPSGPVFSKPPLSPSRPLGV
ncbi:hypothetical protein PUNSTDRAFT_48683, partial [Punctularia strigosozonata HHB-11173 SS5]|uniref:uncharacterized protein n=1 Tax=Punctularia strigosozonata (strain HHB-11173) TaxID=741275 RepID=UPI0004417083